MLTFILNDIVRYNNNIIGTITNVLTNKISILISQTTMDLSLDAAADSAQGFILNLLQKKIADDNWVDKDGNHYTNDGINITFFFQKLRKERNKKLKDCDYLLHPDYPISSDTFKQNWITYRQELRDLPATSNPHLDDNVNLTNITWPTPPS